MDFIKHFILTIFLAGKEPIVGPMWFVYVLFMALIGLSLISWIISKITFNSQKREWICFTFLIGITIISGILSNKYGLTIRRFSNVFTAMLLIHIGWLMNKKFGLKYTNTFIAIVCAMIGFEIACMLGGVSLNGNEYKDICQLIIGGPAILYCILYFGKKIEHTFVGKAIAKIGYDSFYIMALHLTGFKLCTILIDHISGGDELSSLTPNVGDSIFLLFIYLAFGVGFPMLFMMIFRKAKSVISEFVDKK